MPVNTQCLNSSVKFRGLENCSIPLDLIWYLGNTINLLKSYLGDKFEASVVHTCTCEAITMRPSP